MNPPTHNPLLSIILPALNEQDNVEPLIQEITEKVLDKGIDAEVIIVDDGSTDQTVPRLLALMTTRPWLRLVRHQTRGGPSAAMWTGFRQARGAIFATLDADRQNDPGDLLAMLDIIQSGKADMVQGDRSAHRRDNWIRRMSSWVGRKTRGLLLRDPVRDTACAARMMKRELGLLLPLHLRGMHRFISVYLRMTGAKVAEMPVNHRPRVAGKAKFGIWNRALPGLRDCFAVRWMKSRYCVPALKDDAPFSAPPAAPPAGE
ncbi:MAG: glycosyltransferase family 2 protein [Phycisphaeraceae bacterium]